MTDYLPPTDELAVGDLVVDRPHRALVERRLADLWLAVTEVHDSPALGLVRLVLRDTQRFAHANGADSAPGAAIQAVLGALRSWCAEQFGGWIPELEGNATVTGIVGYPHTKPMSAYGLSPTTREPFEIRASGRGAGVKVAVLDTAFHAHPDLAGHCTAADRDTLPRGGSTPVAAWNGHATFVAGIVARAAPGCEIVVHKVLRDDGRSTVWDTAHALAAVAGQGYDVVNLSLGCRVGGPTGPLALRRAVTAHTGGAVLVAAAGNHGEIKPAENRRLPVWPAAFPGVTAVGATLPGGEIAPITPKLPWVDLVAPGVDVGSTFLEGEVMTDERTISTFEGYATWSGTSFAAARVTGALAALTVPDRTTSREALAAVGEADAVPYVWPAGA